MIDRRALTFGLSFLGLLGPELAAAQESGKNLTPQDVEALNKISDYVNRIDTLKGNFIQVASNGIRDAGKFYFRRPGRLRFEYDEPNPVLIIADGKFIAVTNKELKTVDRLPISSHPLRVLLRKNVDFAAEEKVVAVKRIPGSVSVLARDDEGVLQGELEIVFADPAIELLQWRIVDAQGFAITIALRDLVRDEKVDSKLFHIEEEENPFRDRRR